jgi:hypothetical protein
MSLRRKPASTATLIPRTSTNSGFALTSSGAVGFAEDAHTEHNLSSTGMSALGLHQQIQSLQSKVRDLEKGSSTQSKTESMQKTTVMNNRDAFQKISASSWPKAAEVSLGEDFEPTAHLRRTVMAVSRKVKKIYKIEHLLRMAGPINQIIDLIINVYESDDMPVPVTVEWLRAHITPTPRNGRNTMSFQDLYENCKRTHSFYNVFESVIGSSPKKIMDSLGSAQSHAKYNNLSLLHENAEKCLWDLAYTYEKKNLGHNSLAKIWKALVFAKNIFVQKETEATTKTQVTKVVIPTEDQLKQVDDKIKQAFSEHGSVIYTPGFPQEYTKLANGIQVPFESAKLFLGLFQVYHKYQNIKQTCQLFETEYEKHDVMKLLRNDRMDVKSPFSDGYPHPITTAYGQRPWYEDSRKMSFGSPMTTQSHSHDRMYNSEENRGRWHSHQNSDSKGHGHSHSGSKHANEHTRRGHGEKPRLEEQFCSCEKPIPVRIQKRIPPQPLTNMSSSSNYCQCAHPIPMRSSEKLQTANNFCQCEEPVPVKTSGIEDRILQEELRRKQSRKKKTRHGRFGSHGPHIRNRPGGYFLRPRPRRRFSEEITDGAGPLFQSHDFDEYYY